MVVTAALVRFVVLAFCAAALVIEHVRLAVRAHRPGRPQRLALALAVPGAAAVLAWREGRRLAPIVYGALAVGYLGLWFWP